MRYGILGPTQVSADDGREVAVGGPRLRALLARLLVEAGRVVSAERLIDDLYGDQPPAGAANALQSQVSRLRRALPEPVVELHPAGYRLAVEPDDVDAHRFMRLAAAGHRMLAAGEHARAADLLTEGHAQWRGPALADVMDAPFAAGHAARLHELRLAAAEDRIEARLALGEAAPLVPELQALVEAHPLRERLRGQLMRALYGSGRQAEALATFEDARHRLADQLGADPSPELAAVHRAVLQHAPSAAPARPAAPVPAGEPPVRPPSSRGLPAQLTSFVGRDEEVRRVGKLLGEARLVTITGPGGAGKTRLAVESAAGRRSGEVCLVELAPLVDGADVPQAVLSALGLRDAGLRDPSGPDSTDRLAAALADRPLLLLLDNCEHVVGAAARLAARLLGACPALRILATSREPLGLTGEVLCPLSGLEPDGSMRLFLDRAGDIAPESIVDESDAVRTICRTLDGLPLAIELAAARLRSLPVAEIAARLDDRFALLTRGSRAAQPRHQTLRAVVGWSWDLLEATEQALARRLSVFAGGATLAAVEQVAGAPSDQLVDPLANLVDKSLVESAGGRYRMLETIRAYGAERLAEAGEAEALRRAHATYFVTLAETADPHLRRSEQLSWLSRLDADRGNLHAALRRAVASGDHPTALRLVSALSMYWWLRGLRGEAAVLAGGVLAMLSGGPPSGWEEEYALCMLTATVGGRRPPATAEWAPEPLAARLDRQPRQPFLMFLAAMAAGPPAPGPDQLEPMVERSVREFHDPWIRALAPVGLGLLRMYNGQLAEAERHLIAGREAFRAIGERWGLMTVLANLAELADWRGEHETAEAAMGEALDLAEQLGSTVDMADQLRVRGGARARAGDLAGAQLDHQRAIDLARRAGAPELVAASRAGLGDAARLAGDLAGARRLCETALAECPTGWFAADGTRSGILAALAWIAEAEDRPDHAGDWYRQALAGPVPALAEAVPGLVRLALREGRGEQAAMLLGAGTVLRRTIPMVGALDTGPLTSTLQEELGEALYEQAFARGAALPVDEAWQAFGAPPSVVGA